jgi:hypothetical protein
VSRSSKHGELSGQAESRTSSCVEGDGMPSQLKFNLWELGTEKRATKSVVRVCTCGLLRSYVPSGGGLLSTDLTRHNRALDVGQIDTSATQLLEREYRKKEVQLKQRRGFKRMAENTERSK